VGARGEAENAGRGPGVAILVAHLALTLTLAIVLDVWLDEAYSLHTSGGTLAEAWRGAIGFELQPPFYFVLLWFWRTVSASILDARLLSVWCVAATVALAPGLSRRFWPSAPEALLTALVAFNPFTVWAAVEIRLYALALLLTALLLVHFHDGYLADRPQGRSRVLHALFGLLALYTQYYLGFLLAAGALALAAVRRWRALRDYVLAMAGVGALFSPMLLVVPHQVSAHTGTVATRLSLRYSARILAWRIQNYVLPTAFAPETARWVVFAAFLLVVLVAGARALRARGWSGVEMALLTLTASVAAAFYGVLHITGEELFSPKHTIAIFLPTLLSLGVVLLRGVGRRALWAWAGVAALAYGASLVTNYRPLAKEGDTARIAARIRTAEKPNQPILVFTAQAAVPLSLYYHGENRLVALPRAMDFRTFDLHDFILHDETEIWTALGSPPAAGQEVWLVTQGPRHYLDVAFGADVLEGVVARRFDVEQDLFFFKARLRLLRAR
jgi:uncharacterized membrane protein